MTHKIGTKGQVVIPKEMRDALGLTPGMRVDFALQQGSVGVRKHRSSSSLSGSFKDLDLVNDLLEDRAKERG
ncbi:MAG: AbrB/MazE/SpoVT family DNA-binding domain-containing protein [Solirubrobacterales bacterium]